MTTSPTQGEHAQPALLPCPFCGAAAHFESDSDGWNWVECESCGMQGNRSASLMEDCKPKLREAWNTRAGVHPDVASGYAKGWEEGMSEATALLAQSAKTEHAPAVVSTNGAESNMTGGAVPAHHTDNAPLGYTSHEKSAWSFGYEEGYLASHGQAPAVATDDRDKECFCFGGMCEHCAPKRPTAQPAPAANYDHGPQSTTVEEAARHVGKWLNERPNRPLDLRDVAMLVAHAQAPAAGAVAGPTDILALVTRYGAEFADYLQERRGNWTMKRAVAARTRYRSTFDQIEAMLAAAPTPAAQGDAWPSDDEVRAAYKDAFGLTPAGAIWLNLGILAEALRTRRAALAQKEVPHGN